MTEATAVAPQKAPLARAPEGYTLRDARPEDDAKLRQLMNVPIPSRGVQLSFEREPSYFAAQDVMFEHRLSAVISEDATGDVVATFGNGWRQCFINGIAQPMRYSSDLRVAVKARGLKLVKYLTPEMQRQMETAPHFTQTIVFDDNEAARVALRSGKAGMPPYYDGGLIKTLTLTGFKRKQPRVPSGTYRMRMATAQDAKAMTEFVASMAQFFNGLPCYRFEDLLNGSAYYRGLHIGDFVLAYKGDQLVGLVGLWDQKSFKQTRITDYERKIGLARPFYNLWARMAGGLHLPQKGGLIRYHVLHSLLCHPHQLDLHDALIREAWRISVHRGVRAISYTLSEFDPRLSMNDDYKGEHLTGLYGYFSFKGDPTVTFDRDKVPYLECGRI